MKLILQHNIDNSSLFLEHNFSNLTRAGFAFNGAGLDGIVISKNEMQEHFFDAGSTLPSGSLHLGNNAAIGVQNDAFNRFIGTNNFAFRSPGTSALNVFLYNLTFQSNSFFVPPHFPFNLNCIANDFFQCNGAESNVPDPVPCTVGSSIPGNNMVGSGGGVLTTVAALAAGQTLFFEYDIESRFELSKSYARRLEQNLLDLPNNGFFQNWKDSLLNSNASKLNRVDKFLSETNSNSAYLALTNEYSLATNDYTNSAKTFFSSITSAFQFDSLNFNLQYQSLINKEQIAHNLYENVQTEDSIFIQSKVDNATQLNNSLQVNNEMEEMEKNINTIYLNTVAKKVLDFSANQLEIIQNIAFQCPLKSPNAVYKAREMYLLENPLQNFDNYSLCANQGMQYRIGNTNNNLLSLTQNGNILEINYKGEGNIKEYKILNMFGQVITVGLSNNKRELINIKDLDLSGGLYVIQAQSTSGNFSSSKIVLNK